MKKKANKSEKIRALLKRGKSVQAIAKAMKIKPAYVYQIRFKTKHKGEAKIKTPLKRENTKVEYDSLEVSGPTFSHLELGAWVTQVADMLDDLKAAQRVIDKLSPIPVT